MAEVREAEVAKQDWLEFTTLLGDRKKVFKKRIYGYEYKVRGFLGDAWKKEEGTLIHISQHVPEHTDILPVKAPGGFKYEDEDGNTHYALKFKALDSEDMWYLPAYDIRDIWEIRPAGGATGPSVGFGVLRF